MNVNKLVQYLESTTDVSYHKVRILASTYIWFTKRFNIHAFSYDEVAETMATERKSMLTYKQYLAGVSTMMLFLYEMDEITESECEKGRSTIDMLIKNISSIIIVDYSPKYLTEQEVSELLGYDVKIVTE